MIDTSRFIHVIPRNDIKNHLPHPSCACQPSVEERENGDALVTHFAWDGREFFEEKSTPVYTPPTFSTPQ